MGNFKKVGAAVAVVAMGLVLETGVAGAAGSGGSLRACLRDGVDVEVCVARHLTGYGATVNDGILGTATDGGYNTAILGSAGDGGVNTAILGSAQGDGAVNTGLLGWAGTE